MPAQQPPSSESQHSARSTFRQRLIQGEVQDENASILGGVAATRRPLLHRPRRSQIRPRHAQRRTPHPPPRNRLPLHPPRIRAPRHIPRPGLGHSLHPVAIRKIFFANLLRPPRLHRHLSLDRPHPPTLDHPANQPHLARLLQPSHQTSPPQIPRRSNRSPFGVSVSIAVDEVYCRPWASR